ncbi:MAG: META domain-containing protein [Caldilineaceae bacterium]
MKRVVWIILFVAGVFVLAAYQQVAMAADNAAPADATTTEAVGLAGTSWLLSSLNGDLPLSGTTVTLDFGDDNTVSGSDGCNQFSTTYTQSGNDLTIAAPAASTLMACAAEVMVQATDYMDALTSVTSFISVGNQLILKDASEILATFVASSQNTANTKWEVTGYNNGREAVVGPLLGTEIIVEFSDDGIVSGNAGCNYFFAGYAVEENEVGIETPATTFRFCESPDGVMEQEAEFLAALESAATFSIQGNLLEMRTAEDQIAVQMVRVFEIDLPEPDPSAPWGRVIAPAGVNVRSGPGVNFPVVGSAAFNDEGKIVGRSADSRWWAVAAPSLPGGMGWVSADFVIAYHAEDVPVIQVAPPPAPEPTAVPPATPTPAPAPTATPAAQISFSASPTTMNQGQCSTLQWNAQNVQAVWVYPQGRSYYRYPRSLQGSEQICPPTTTTYEMRSLRRDGGVDLRQVTVTVNPTAEPQISFWADSTSIRQGECTRLRWDVQNVQAVWVYPQGANYNRYPRVGQDSERVCPGSTTTYEMRVQLRDGSTVFRTVTVNVTAPTPTPVANPLAGTSWQVVQFNNGNGITTLLSGTSINFAFGTGSEVSGNSGCNNFGGTYRVNGNNLSVSQLAGGMMMCGAPAGVMDQEAQFQSALSSASTFSISGNQLTIQNSAGQIAVVANR